MRLHVLAALALVMLLAAACGGGSLPDAAQLPDTGYLTEEIAPCTPVDGAVLDPCEEEAQITMMSMGGGGGGRPPEEPQFARC